MQFPRLVYRSASDYLLADDPIDFNAALENGWYASVPEALAGPLKPHIEVVKDDAPPTRAELETKAAELDIKVDGRWSDAKLASVIEKSLEV